MPRAAPQKILIVTSCTGEKAVEHENELTINDLRQDKAHIKAREAELADIMLPAEKLYTGLQHARLMRGVQAIRANKDFTIDLYVLSAGYGLVRGSKKLAPYDATFNGMKTKQLAEWAHHLNVPRDIRKVLSKSYDLILVLLGDGYLRACQLDDDVALGGSAIFFTGKASANRLPILKNLKAQILANADTKQFACGLVGLKGEVVARLLETFAANKLTPTGYARNPGKALDKLAAQGKPADDEAKAKPKPAKAVAKRPRARANPVVDEVIQIPSSWWDKPHRAKLKYFIPEWDDLVDPDYDFETDTHSGGSGDWSNQVYAHQMYAEPTYDGILVSRAVAEHGKKKNERINSMGVHRFLRVPRSYSVMGDCGAFDYINEQSPPYTTNDVIDYYTRLDFDYGVSVDHLVVPAFESERQYRYDLTVSNAADFIKEHRRLGLSWEPIGAVQGWDEVSYTDAAKKCVAMGYRYIALGGLVRSQTAEILRIVAAVRTVVPNDIQIHVFGFSRLDGINDLIEAGANSIDSASMLRKAWLGANQNYLTENGWYSAVRIPQVGRSFRAKNLVKDGSVSLSKLEKLESICLHEIRTFGASSAAPSKKLVDHIVEYDTLVAGKRPGTEETIRRTLEDRPWQKCQCAICKTWGVEVIIFRGNNRNRRRGFHNTFIFYEQLQKLIAGESIHLLGDTGHRPQLSLFNTPGEAA